MKKIILLTLFLTLFGCQKENVKLLKMIILPPGIEFDKIPVGGLSGITYDETTNQLYTVSDDRGRMGPRRIDIFNLSHDGKEDFSIAHSGRILIEQNITDDFEGIAFNESGNLFVSAEGEQRADAPYKPAAIIEIDKTGKTIGNIKLPSQYLDKEKGIDSNTGLESLCLTENQSYLFTANEDALKMDQESKKPFVRILRMRRDQGSYIEDDTFLYNLNSEAKGDEKEFKGLADLLCLSHNELITLERSYLPKQEKMVINLYRTILDDKNKELKKTTFLNLKDLIGQKEFKEEHIDNFEGISFGPRLKNGNRTLILVSDNNFSPKQKTIFLFLELK